MKGAKVRQQQKYNTIIQEKARGTFNKGGERGQNMQIATQKKGAQGLYGKYCVIVVVHKRKGWEV